MKFPVVFLITAFSLFIVQSSLFSKLTVQDAQVKIGQFYQLLLDKKIDTARDLGEKILSDIPVEKDSTAEMIYLRIVIIQEMAGFSMSDGIKNGPRVNKEIKELASRYPDSLENKISEAIKLCKTPALFGGNTQKAGELLKKIAQDNSSNSEILYFQAITFKLNGDKKSALSVSESYKQLAPGPRSVYLEAYLKQ